MEWLLIPNDDTDLGDCLVGKWLGCHTHFVAHQRTAPTPAWVQFADNYTHYNPLNPPANPVSQTENSE